MTLEYVSFFFFKFSVRFFFFENEKKAGFNEVLLKRMVEVEVEVGVKKPRKVDYGDGSQRIDGRTDRPTVEMTYTVASKARKIRPHVNNVDIRLVT